MNLCGLSAATNVHPETWNIRNIRAMRVRLEAQNVGIKVAGQLHIFRSGSDTYTVVMQLYNFDRHTAVLLQVQSIMRHGVSVREYRIRQDAASSSQALWRIQDFRYPRKADRSGQDEQPF